MTKAEARTHFRRRRALLSSDDQALMSARLAERFFEEIDLSNVRSLNSFLPLARHNEPDTVLLLERLNLQHPNIRLSVPYLPEGAKTLLPAAWEPGMEMEAGAHGTTHPLHPEKLLYAELDMVLVPLLAYDTFGYRVGYGGGYYDRFLEKCRPQVRKIGLSFFEPIDVIDDIWAGDIRLDACITPDTLHLFTSEAGIRKEA